MTPPKSRHVPPKDITDVSTTIRSETGDQGIDGAGIVLNLNGNEADPEECTEHTLGNKRTLVDHIGITCLHL